eukprot:6200957-Pleurochrysis_carterae.AAC.1
MPARARARLSVRERAPVHTKLHPNLRALQQIRSSTQDVCDYNSPCTRARIRAALRMKPCAQRVSACAREHQRNYTCVSACA